MGLYIKNVDQYRNSQNGTPTTQEAKGHTNKKEQYTSDDQGFQGLRIFALQN